MSEIEKFISKRKARNPKAWAKFEEKYRTYAIGMLLGEHRARSGLSLSQFARRTHLQKTAISRLENHGEDVRISTITRYVEATRKPLVLRIYPSAKPRSHKLFAAVELQRA